MKPLRYVSGFDASFAMRKPYIPNAMGDAVFLVFPAAELTFDLDVSATLERSGKLSELGPANDTVPLGPGFPIARVFVFP